MNSRIANCSLVMIALVFVGCNKKNVAEFEPNMVYAKGLEIKEGISMARALSETQDALKLIFGEPDNPQMPGQLSEGEFADLISAERIKAATQPIQGKSGLYAKHCATCHGITGNGRGTTAALLDPYPRDYRAGKYKFKSTPRGAKPLREDLFYTIRHGIDGTSMKEIPELTDADVEALVDYVIYLSIRGELERKLLNEGMELDYEADERLFDVSAKTTAPDKYKEQLELVNELLTEVIEPWVEAKEKVKEIPELPTDFPVPATREEVLQAVQSSEDSPLKASVMRGKEIFASEAAACSKCHGKEGYGDGQTQDYDDWTKEWTKNISIDPADEQAQIPLVARGALPPRKILPRDFRIGLFRGGAKPEQIYRRIAEGIDGTPMPANMLPTEDIWHLVNYVRSLKSESEETPQ
jgi:mono/diheme cytochrome c family protein